MHSTLMFIASISAVAANLGSYNGYKVYHVQTANEEQAGKLLPFQEDADFDFWRGDRSQSDIMVASDKQAAFEKFLRENEIHHHVMIENVTNAAVKSLGEAPRLRSKSGMLLNKYHRYDQIKLYLQRFAKEHWTSVSYLKIGKSFESREIIAIKISSGGIPNKPAILIEGGMHAREWISPATLIYIMHQLVEDPSKNYLYENVDWYFIPVLNPDGYEYSHTQKRFWRKTMSRGAICRGVDINRNFNYHWGGPGSSDSECSPVYCGRQVFSEPETRSLEDFTYKKIDNIKLYLSVQAYGAKFIYPWGYTDLAAPNADQLQALGEQVVQAMQKVGDAEYKVGYSYVVTYPKSGISIDWFRGSVNVSLSYILKLPDYGHGFLIPENRIVNIASEAFAGVEVLGQYIAKNSTKPSNQ